MSASSALEHLFCHRDAETPKNSGRDGVRPYRIDNVKDRELNPAVPAGEFFERYAKGDLPWQIDRPQPEVLRLLEEGKFESPVLDLGCGAGDNAIELARRGYRVLGMDLVPEALRMAREKAEKAGLARPPEFHFAMPSGSREAASRPRRFWTAPSFTFLKTRKGPPMCAVWRQSFPPGADFTSCLLASWKHANRVHVASAGKALRGLLVRDGPSRKQSDAGIGIVRGLMGLMPGG